VVGGREVVYLRLCAKSDLFASRNAARGSDMDGFI